MRFPEMKTDPELLRLLEAAAKRPMTPAQHWRQRVSFVYGQMMDCAPQVTREQIEKWATDMYGPCPEDPSDA